MHLINLPAKTQYKLAYRLQRIERRPSGWIDIDRFTMYLLKGITDYEMEAAAEETVRQNLTEFEGWRCVNRLHRFAKLSGRLVVNQWDERRQCWYRTGELSNDEIPF